MLFDITKKLTRQGLAFSGDNNDDLDFVKTVNPISKHNPTLKAWINSK